MAQQVDQAAQVVAADELRQVAMMAGDVDALGALLSDELVYVHTTGDTDTKVSYLEAVRSGFVRYRHLEHVDQSVVVRPESVITAGRQVGLSLLRGEPRLIDSAYLSVWVLEDGVWRLGAWHATVHAPTR